MVFQFYISGLLSVSFGGAWPARPSIAVRPNPTPSHRQVLVAPKPIILAKGSIDSELVAASVIARDRLLELHSEAGADTADTVMAMLRQHLPSLLVVDADFVVEAPLLEHLCGTSSEDRLLNHILETFPTVTKQVSLEDCLQAHLGKLGGVHGARYGVGPWHRVHGMGAYAEGLNCTPWHCA